MKLEKIFLSVGMLGALGLITAGCGSSTNSTSTSSATSVSSQSSSTSQPQISPSAESSSNTETSDSQQTSNSTQIDNQNSKTSSSESTSQTADVSPETVGVLVALWKSPDWFKGGLEGGSMYYGDSWKYGDEKTKGYNFITAKGDPTSYIYYKQNGDKIIVKYVDPKEGESVAEASITSKEISLKGLLRDYYTTKDQQAEVNDYVSKLKPYKD